MTANGQLPDIGEDYIVQRYWRSSGEADLYIAAHVKGGKHVVKLFRSVEDEDRKVHLNWLERQMDLQHPRILQIKDVGLAREPAGRPFAVTEYFIWESTLRDLVRVLGPPPPRLAEQIVLAVLEGLAYSHGLEPLVLHRDLKPENVLVVTSKTHLLNLKLIDFSMAATTGYQIAGTPPYQSPEQTFRNSELTPASDIFSAGVIFYELLTGRPPFQDSSLTATQDRIRTEEVELDDDRIDSYQAEFLRRCLAKDPFERFDSASEAFAFLRAKPPTLPARQHIHRFVPGIILTMMGVILLATLVVVFADRDEEVVEQVQRPHETNPVEPRPTRPPGEADDGDSRPGPRNVDDTDATTADPSEVASSPRVPFTVAAQGRLLASSWSDGEEPPAFRGTVRLRAERCPNTQSCYLAVFRDDTILVWGELVSGTDQVSLSGDSLRRGSVYDFILVTADTLSKIRGIHDPDRSLRHKDLASHLRHYQGSLAHLKLRYEP